jgi:L-malate glycosyltransferase
MVKSAKVLILYKFLPQWRFDFFNKLRSSLQKENIELNIVYGKLKNTNAKKNDEVDLDWGQYEPNVVFKVGKIELLWQPALRQIINSDLIIVEQANKLLMNYVLMLLRTVTKKRIAFWGHGINMQDKHNSVGNKIKKLYSNRCDWWFAYTNNVKKTILENGFHGENITVVNNAIDTRSLSETYVKVTSKELEEIQKYHKIGNGPIGLYCGGMYKEKRLDFLIEACLKIKESIPDFEMIFIGAGPEEDKVKNASLEHAWIHYVGPKFNNDKVPYFKMADVFLMPGLVGLAILDSFAMQAPLITTNYPYHSPEIEYLENGTNGIMTENALESYCQNIVSLLKDKNILNEFKNGCIESAKIYTIENMISNFTDGIVKALR